MIGGIQVLRGLAALLVVIHHLLEELRATEMGFWFPDFFVRLGAVGVDIFFIISGFIMYYTTSTAFKNPQPAKFYLSRVARIFPPYLIIVTFILLLHSSGYFYRSLDLSWDMTIRSILLFPADSLILGVAWTLIYEMYFYSLFAVGLLFKRKCLIPVVTMGILSGYLLAGYVTDSAIHKYLSNPIVFDFLLGILIGLCFGKFRTVPTINYLWLAASMIAVTMSSAWLDSSGTTGLLGWDRVSGWGLGSVGIVWFFLHFRVRESRAQSILLEVGNSSYAIYLTHPIIMIVVAKALSLNFGYIVNGLVFTGSLLASLILGVIYYRYIEGPACKWTKHALVKKPIAPVAAQLAPR